MNKIIGSIFGVIAFLAIAYFLFFNESIVNSPEIWVKPSFGDFNTQVTTTGELQAKSSIEIRGPGRVNTIGIYEMTISKLIPEGTVVKKGDFVAELDQGQIITKMKEVEINLEKLLSQYTLSTLDSSLTLSEARDQLDNLKFGMEEAKLTMEQSQYEAPAVIRRAEIDYQKAERNYKQSIQNYTTKVNKAVANITVANAEVEKEKQKLKEIMSLFEEFTIYAPADGMLIYEREWGGRRREVNSQVRSWDPTVALLPDLSAMQSITYVNEVDIKNVKLEQKVEVKLDADPDKKLKGKVSRIANIGEQRQGSDAKVFEVVVDIIEQDTTLRPAMTTSNIIETATLKNVLSIPLECLHTIEDGDKKTNYVFLKSKNKTIKKEVKLGLINDTSVVIEEGINQEDEIMLSSPQNHDDFELILLKSDS